MKPRLSVIASAFALVILIIIQYYNISVTFQTKKQQFDIRYGNLVRQALYEYESHDSQNQLDSVLNAFDNLAADLVFQGLFPDDVPGSDSLRSTIVNSFSMILQSHNKPGEFLAGYLEEAGADPDFISGYNISELSLLNFETIIPIYSDTTNVNPAGLQNALQADSYVEGDYYRIHYEYFVDFTHKTQIIYRDMIITFVFAVVTILIVLVIFTLTFRTMLIQQRL